MVRGAHDRRVARVIDPLPPAWDGAVDDQLVCVDLRRETHDVSTFVFAATQPRLFRFQPGQFMTLDLAAAGVQRCYTIASPPTRPFRIEITVKRSPQGPGSGWLHTTMRPGVRVHAQGPFGTFVLPRQPPPRLLFLSAGSGITPLMSMARTLHDLGADTDVLFVHSARSARDLIFVDELSAMARRPGFRAVSVVEQAPWDGFQGRLSPELLRLVAPDIDDRDIYCCGPAPYMAAVRAMLDTAGFDRARYHEESFDFAAGGAEPGPEAISKPPAGEQTYEIRFTRLGRSIVCPAGTTVLAAARAAGVRMPSACGTGVCGTCKSHLVSGTVTLAHGGGIRQREVDAGLTLLCCARPSSDLVVDR